MVAGEMKHCEDMRGYDAPAIASEYLVVNASNVNGVGWMNCLDRRDSLIGNLEGYLNRHLGQKTRDCWDDSH